MVQIDADIATHVRVIEDGPKRRCVIWKYHIANIYCDNSATCLAEATKFFIDAEWSCLNFSLLSVETADRPGLLLEMIKIMSDVNINVESAEIDTEVIFSLWHTSS